APFIKRRAFAGRSERLRRAGGQSIGVRGVGVCRRRRLILVSGLVGVAGRGVVAAAGGAEQHREYQNTAELPSLHSRFSFRFRHDRYTQTGMPNFSPMVFSSAAMATRSCAMLSRSRIVT